MRGALVTGASRGIGRATAIALSARGEKVAVHYGRRREEAERTLAALHGDGHVLVGGDLTDPGTAQRVVEAQSPFGRVGTAEEVAEAICDLTSPGAQWASGTVLDLNGASHLRS